MIELAAGDYRLVLEPERGGSVAAFEWRAQPLFRPTCGPSILDAASFPLVPFSNRIANGRFRTEDGPVRLAPNMPGSDHPHTLHGFGWLAPWEVCGTSTDHAVLRHRHKAGEWPWDYLAEQVFELTAEGLVQRLMLRNDGAVAMPAGLGVHPYFPRTAATLYRGLHHGEWLTGNDGLPVTLREADQPCDWWDGAPVTSRTVDTVYTGRRGPLVIQWPERRLELTLTPGDELGFTVVYTPAGEDFFCVEPVSHPTDAVNRNPAALRWLAPGESFACSVTYRASTLAPE